MGSIHQTNSESTNFFNEYYYDFFFNYKTEKRKLLSLFTFSTAQTKKKLWNFFWENKIRCLVVWSHELIIICIFKLHTFFTKIPHLSRSLISKRYVCPSSSKGRIWHSESVNGLMPLYNEFITCFHEPWIYEIWFFS